jgi:hypothetical protein
MVFAYFVMRTANTMNLEDQANLKKRIETAIKEMAEALKTKCLKYKDNDNKTNKN